MPRDGLPTDESVPRLSGPASTVQPTVVVVTTTVVDTGGGTTTGRTDVVVDAGGDGVGGGRGDCWSLECRCRRTRGAGGAVMVEGIGTRLIAGGDGTMAAGAGRRSCSARTWTASIAWSEAVSVTRLGSSATPSSTNAATAAPPTRGLRTKRRRNIVATTAPATTSATATPR